MERKSFLVYLSYSTRPSVMIVQAFTFKFFLMLAAVVAGKTLIGTQPIDRKIFNDAIKKNQEKENSNTEYLSQVHVGQGAS